MGDPKWVTRFDGGAMEVGGASGDHGDRSLNFHMLAMGFSPRVDHVRVMTFYDGSAVGRHG